MTKYDVIKMCKLNVSWHRGADPCLTCMMQTLVVALTVMMKVSGPKLRIQIVLYIYGHPSSCIKKKN